MARRRVPCAQQSAVITGNNDWPERYQVTVFRYHEKTTLDRRRSSGNTRLTLPEPCRRKRSRSCRDFWPRYTGLHHASDCRPIPALRTSSGSCTRNTILQSFQMHKLPMHSRNFTLWDFPIISTRSSFRETSATANRTCACSLPFDRNENGSVGGFVCGQRHVSRCLRGTETQNENCLLQVESRHPGKEWRESRLHYRALL